MHKLLTVEHLNNKTKTEKKKPLLSDTTSSISFSFTGKLKRLIAREVEKHIINNKYLGLTYSDHDYFLLFKGCHDSFV